jgi:hypothetical protein
MQNLFIPLFSLVSPSFRSIPGEKKDQWALSTLIHPDFAFGVVCPDAHFSEWPEFISEGDLKKAISGEAVSISLKNEKSGYSGPFVWPITIACNPDDKPSYRDSSDALYHRTLNFLFEQKVSNPQSAVHCFTNYPQKFSQALSFTHFWSDSHSSHVHSCIYAFTHYHRLSILQTLAHTHIDKYANHSLHTAHHRHIHSLSLSLPPSLPLSLSLSLFLSLFLSLSLMYPSTLALPHLHSLTCS